MKKIHKSLSLLYLKVTCSGKKNLCESKYYKFDSINQVDSFIKPQLH